MKALLITVLLLSLNVVVLIQGSDMGFSFDVAPNDNDGGADDSGGQGGNSQNSGGDARKAKVNPRASCVYDLDDTLELCNLETATQHVKYELIRGPSRCQQTVVKEIDCLGCKYAPNQLYGPCVKGHKSKVEELVPGSKPGCPVKRKITKECTHGDTEGNTNGDEPIPFALP